MVYSKYEACLKSHNSPEFCVLYKSNKDSREAELFYRILYKIYKPQLKDNKLVFDKEIIFEDYVFPDHLLTEVFFSNAVFEKTVYIENVKFEGEVSFENSVFMGNLVIKNSTFMKDVSFKNLKIFKNLNVDKSRFYRNFSFYNTYIAKTASIHESFFGLGMKVNESKFNNLKIMYSKFSDKVVFLTSNINELFIHNNYFNSEFSLSFVNIDTLMLICNDKYKFMDIIDLNDATINRILFNTNTSSECFVHPLSEANMCRLYRLYATRIGDYRKSDECFYKEKRALRQYRVKTIKENFSTCISIKKNENQLFDSITVETGPKCYFKNLPGYLPDLLRSFLEWLFADLLTRYGNNAGRIIWAWILLFIIIFPSVYLVTGSIGNDSCTCERSYTKFIDCIYYSIITATTLGYGDYTPKTQLGKILSSIESVLGLFLWALFLSVYTRKFIAK